MRQLNGLVWALDQNESSSVLQELFDPAQVQAMSEGDWRGPNSSLPNNIAIDRNSSSMMGEDEGDKESASTLLGNNVSAGTCPDRVLLEVAPLRCERHRSEAQQLQWADSLRAISEAVAQDLQTWAARHRLDLSDSGGSSRRLGARQQRFAELRASIQELDQVIAKLRLVPLHRLITGNQGLVAADLPGEALPLFWSALPFVVRFALLRMSTVCGIGSLLYVLNIHRLAICRLENFGKEYYPASNPKLHNLRRHMSGLHIFGDIMEDLWGGEPSELSFVHLRKLERRLLRTERIARLLAAAEDAAPDRAFLPPCSAVEFDEVASCGGCSWAASELLSERDEVCSSPTSAVCAAERLGRAEEQEAPPSRASSPSIEQDLEMQINNEDDWLAARDDHLHDQRRKLKKEMVEPLVAFPDGEAANFLRGLKTSKGIYVMHLEKRSSTGLDGATYLS
eukprot:g10148.t1